MPKKYRCANCEKTSPKPLPCCKRCGVAAYCNRECQTSHWKTHKKMCKVHQKAVAENIGGGAESQTLLYGHNPGRVHPKDSKIRSHTPVYMNGIHSGEQDSEALRALLNSKKGKRLKKILPKLWRQSSNDKMAESEIKELSGAYSTNILQAWTLQDDPKCEDYPGLKEEIVFKYFETLVHNPGAPGGHSLGGQDWEALLELYGLWGGDLAQRLELDGRGLVHLGAVSGLPAVLTWLAKHGVDPNQPTGYNQMGTTSMSAPLHLAVMHMQMDAIRVLCQLPNIQINQRNMSGKTPLHVLANFTFNDPTGLDEGRGTVETVQAALDLLLEAKADPKAPVEGSWEKQSGLTQGNRFVAIDGMNLADLALQNPVVLSYCAANGIHPTGKRPSVGGGEECIIS